MVGYNFPKPLAIQPEEIEVLNFRKRLSVSQWAVKKRILNSKTTNHSGPWTHDFTPFAIRPMDCLSDPFIRQVTIMACSQSGKSEIGYNFIGWVIDQNPAPTQITMPTKTDMTRRLNIGLNGMFECMPILRKHIPSRQNGRINITKETRLDNMNIYAAYATSPAALADNSVCNMILDEVGKFPPTAGKEGNPVLLAKKRLRTFPNRSKLYCPSTPVIENDLIHTEFLAGTQEEWWCKCDHCGKYNILKWGNVWIEKDSEKNFLKPHIYEQGGHSGYACPDCGVVWSEIDRWQAVSNGVWCPQGCSVDESGQIVGQVPQSSHVSFHISAMMLHPVMQTINNLVKEYVEAANNKKTGTIKPYQDFVNNQLGEPYYEVQKKTEEKQLLNHKGSYLTPYVPDYVQLITQSVDVQKDHFWVLAIGWGYLYRSAIIFADRINTGDTSQLENWKPLEEFLKMTYPRCDGGEIMYPLVTAIDVAYNITVGINFCASITWANVVPVRGDTRVSGIYRKNDKDHFPIIRYDLNVNAIKNTVHELLHRAEVPGPGYMEIPKDCDFELIKQLCSEQQIIETKGGRPHYIWKSKGEHRDNHWWDNTVYCKAMADIAGVGMLRPLDEVQTEKQKTVTEKQINIRTKY